MSDQEPPAGEGAIPAKSSSMRPWEFSGKAGEYFGIWIVNISLNIVTFGVYSAWAKVRRNRYLLGNLKIGGQGLHYHATGVMIFKGRVIALVFLMIYGILSSIGEIESLIATLAFIGALPWIIHRALAFRCRMISWNNIHFRWHGSTLVVLKAFSPFLIAYLPFLLIGLHLVFLGDPETMDPSEIDGLMKIVVAEMILGFLLFLALTPVGIYTYSKALVAHTSWGSLFFESGFSFKNVLFHSLIYFVLPLILIFVFFGTFIVILMTLIELYSDTMPALPPILAGIVFFSVFAISHVGAAFDAKIRDLIVKKAVARERLTEGAPADVSIGFASDISWWRVLWIQVSNFLAIICSVFLLYPWAIIRLEKYLAACTASEFHKDVSTMTQEQQARVSAAASEYADLDGIDVTPW